MIQFDKNPATSPSGGQIDTFATGPGTGAAPVGLKFALPSGSDLGSGSAASRGRTTMTSSGYGYGTASEEMSGGEGEKYVVGIGVGSVGSVGGDGIGVGREKTRSLRIPGSGGIQDEKGERSGEDVEAARASNADAIDPDDWMAEWGRI